MKNVKLVICDIDGTLFDWTNRKLSPKTKEIITFVLEADSEDDAREKVDDMCQKLLCNPIIHNYVIKIIKMDLTCGCGCE